MENTNTPLMDKNFVVPADLNAEVALLGAILLDYKFALNEVLSIVNANDFYKESHQEIYKAMLSLYEQSIPIDSISLPSKLQEMGKMDISGGYSYIAEITSSATTSENVEYYAKIVRGRSQLRQLMKVSHHIHELALQAQSDPHEIVDKAESLIFEIGQNRDRGQSILIKDLMRKTIDYIEERQKNQGSLQGLTSGYKSLDRLTNGFQKSDLIILAARPSMGKTALVLNIAANLGIPNLSSDKEFTAPSILIFSLEMSEDQLIQRILSSEARVDSKNIRTGFLQKKDWNNLLSAMDRISKSRIQISEASGLSHYDMRALARRIQAREGLDLIIIDYLQLITPSGRSDASNRQNEVAEISRSLKLMARELNVPVIALSQLSRDVEKRQGKEPMLSDLRDSGAIEQDADIVSFIHRPGYYDKEDDSKQGIADIIIAKNRNGPIGKARLTFIDSYTRFESYAGDQEYS